MLILYAYLFDTLHLIRNEELLSRTDIPLKKHKADLVSMHRVVHIKHAISLVMRIVVVAEYFGVLSTDEVLFSSLWMQFFEKKYVVVSIVNWDSYYSVWN